MNFLTEEERGKGRRKEKYLKCIETETLQKKN
jgi:hypothetical protein